LEDRKRVLEKVVSLPTRQAAVRTLLATHPDAVVAALADDGFRIPLPDSFELGEHRPLAVPAERATMLDIVVAADRIAVVTAWERARKSGIGVTAVHALSDPGTRLTLSIVDARDDHGVWLSVLAHDDEERSRTRTACPEPSSASTTSPRARNCATS
jgi:hypothetical protein